MNRTIIFGLAIAFGAGFHAEAIGSFPPISYLAKELGLHNGAQLPKGVPWEGRPIFFYVISAVQHPGGRYTVELQAR